MINIKLNKVSIRTRILFIILSLIIFIFLIILAVFNFFVGEFIKSSANEQLKDVRQIVFDDRNILRLPHGSLPSLEQRPGFIPDMRRLPRGIIGSAEAIIVSNNYELVYPDESMFLLRDYEAMSSLVTAMKNERVDLQNDEIMQIKALDSEYYFVSKKIPQISQSDSYYLIYYIDMTAVTSFSDRINSVLLMVMGLAGVLAVGIAVLLSGRIAKPIRELTRFATRIGKGDFSRSNLDYGDIELSELADSMNKAAAQLDAYDHEQKTFFQNVSHELRTPLQAIKCNAEGIEHGILNNQQSSRIIVNETDRLSGMVEDLLYLSRMDSITGGDKFEDCDLREILSNCAERQRSLAAEQKVQFTFEFDNKPVNMHCVEKHMFRAFFNLISNAIRYAKTTITLSCRHTKNGIIVLVQDDGEGIAKEDLPHIFDRFYKGKEGNYGIGLSIVKTIIEQHGGSITVQSNSMGTTFIITF